MFSGGEKKSFYELPFVIGIGIIALKLKINDSLLKRIIIFRLPLLFLRSKQLEVRFFLAVIDISSWRALRFEKGNGDG